ncbi:hypothetical protein [uncultured Actinomyces sp.]|uniref:hypothetical protein n=1 Tax=uncultured Actinomyces sp. TaxID=249061 RepID=UPI0025D31C29|nr:hypothetical protein [uncultured Actinomyces sp.]
MLLVGEHEEDGWIQSTFTLTYRVAWEQLLLAVYGAYRYFSDPEVLVDGKPVEIGTPEEILTIAEDRNIMLRGISTVITAPLMISFYNQVQFVNVSVAAVNDEFRDTDYEKYNKSMGQLMDSMEIMMHLPAPTAEEEPAVSDTPVAQAQAPAEEEPAVSETSAAQEAAPDTDEVSAQAPAGDEPPVDEAQPAAEELFASDENAQERPVVEAQASAEEEPTVSDTSAAQEAAPDTDEVSAQAPAGDEPPSDEAQPADEQVSPLSRLSMELGIPQPPA